MKLFDRLQRRATGWLLCMALAGLLGGVTAGCGTIHTYGGVEHSFGYDFDDYDGPHHHKDYKKYRKEQKKRYKAYKKHQKKMEKERRKHHGKHHHDD